MNMKSTNRNNVKTRITTPPCFHNIRFRRTAQARRLGGRYRITSGVDGWAIFNLYKNKSLSAAGNDIYFSTMRIAASNITRFYNTKPVQAQISTRQKFGE